MMLQSGKRDNFVGFNLFELQQMGFVGKDEPAVGSVTANTLCMMLTTTLDGILLFLFVFSAPLPLTHIRVSLRSTSFVTVTWDAPSGSVFDGFAYDFPRFNESLVRLPPVPLSKMFESLSAESNYTVIFYVTSNSAAGLVLYSLPTVFTFSTCVLWSQTFYFDFSLFRDFILDWGFVEFRFIFFLCMIFFSFSFTFNFFTLSFFH